MSEHADSRAQTTDASAVAHEDDPIIPSRSTITRPIEQANRRVGGGGVYTSSPPSETDPTSSYAFTSSTAPQTSSLVNSNVDGNAMSRNVGALPAPLTLTEDNDDDDDDDDETLIGMEDFNNGYDHDAFVPRNLFGFDFTGDDHGDDDTDTDDHHRRRDRLGGGVNPFYLRRWPAWTAAGTASPMGEGGGGGGGFPTDTHQERRRHSAVVRELERTQRSNFSHFVLLCLVPTSLLLIVIVSVLGDQSQCHNFVGPGISCKNEPRTFVNAFTTRCLCDAVRVN